MAIPMIGTTFLRASRTSSAALKLCRKFGIINSPQSRRKVRWKLRMAVLFCPNAPEPSVMSMYSDGKKGACTSNNPPFTTIHVKTMEVIKMERSVTTATHVVMPATTRKTVRMANPNRNPSSAARYGSGSLASSTCEWEKVFRKISAMCSRPIQNTAGTKTR